MAAGLLGQCDQVMLFADAGNPASNSVYQRLGFAAVAEFVNATLVDAEPT